MQAPIEAPVSNRLTPRDAAEAPVVALAVSLKVGEAYVIDEHFGRCAGFLLVSGDGAEHFINNTGRDAAHGAGTGASRLLASHGVVVVIGPRFGPKAEAALAASGIECFVAAVGTKVHAAMEAYHAGSLIQAGV